MSQTAGPALSRLTGEFVDPVVEHQYRLETWGDRLVRFRFVGFVGAGFYLLGLAVDLLEPRLVPMLGWLVLIRVVVAACIVLAVHRGSRLKDHPRRLDSLLALILLVVVAGTSVILGMSPQSLLQATTTVIVLVLVFYVLVPIRATLVMLSGVTLSAVFVLVLLAGYQTGPRELSVVVFYLLLVNIFGAISNRHVRITRRRRYLALLAERETAAELRGEIQARTAAERQLAESEARFRNLVELSPDAILVHRGGRVLYVNAAGLRLMGASSLEPFLGRSYLEFVHPDDRDTVTRRQRDIESEGGGLPPNEVRLCTLDDRELSCEVLSGVTVYEGEPAVQSVVRDISDRKRLEEELTRLATTDPLTGIDNRRSFFDHLEREWSRARRYSRRLSILMFDLDHFKRINDRHGHAVGDRVLVVLVEAARDLLRENDTLGRLGGEEFAILLPEIGLDGAVAVAERLRERLSDVSAASPEGEVRCTISVGVVQARLAHESPDAALKRADDALYRAKDGGRDRVETG